MKIWVCQDSERKKDATAWMVRQDGLVVPVVQHIYTGRYSVEETLYAAQWYYQYTMDDEMKVVITSFIREWAVKKLKSSPENIYDTILSEIKKKPYIFLSEKFVTEHKNEIMKEIPEQYRKFTRDKYYWKITLGLNEEFIRVRYGGLYNTEPGNKNLYFRVSSENYVWNDVVIAFINAMGLDYDTFSVVVDEESAQANPKILENGKYFLRPAAE